MSRIFDRERFRRDHRWARARMSAYLDGELALSRRDRMKPHLAECPECRRLLAALRKLVDGLQRLPAPGWGADATQVAASVRLRLTEPE
jgi:anti-sigma factor RsiW